MAMLGVRGVAWLVEEAERVKGAGGGPLLTSFDTTLIWEISSAAGFTFSFGVSHRGSGGGCNFLQLICALQQMKF